HSSQRPSSRPCGSHHNRVRIPLSAPLQSRIHTINGVSNSHPHSFPVGGAPNGDYKGDLASRLVPLDPRLREIAVRLVLISIARQIRQVSARERPGSKGTPLSITARSAPTQDFESPVAVPHRSLNSALLAERLSRRPLPSRTIRASYVYFVLDDRSLPSPAHKAPKLRLASTLLAEAPGLPVAAKITARRL